MKMETKIAMKKKQLNTLLFITGITDVINKNNYENEKNT